MFYIKLIKLLNNNVSQNIIKEYVDDEIKNDKKITNELLNTIDNLYWNEIDELRKLLWKNIIIQ